VSFVITVQGVSKFLSKTDILQNVSFHLHAGERVGLIGVNGAGKSTLFHLLLGEIEPDSGTVLVPKNITIGHLPQEALCFSGNTILAHAMDVSTSLKRVQQALATLQEQMERETSPQESQALAHQHTHLVEQVEALGGYDLEARACKILLGLGFRESGLREPAATLSGGWMMRLALARLLLAEPDVLLLDEPTNHLDLEALLWLEQFLLTSRMAMIIISHDRVFLNRSVERILELDQGRLQVYAGNYDHYLAEKSRRQQMARASHRNQQERVRQVERFIARNRTRKDRARQVQSRLKMLEKMDMTQAPREQATVRFAFPDPLQAGKRVLELRGAGKAYGEHWVYTGLDVTIERSDRIVFLGPNGAGKSTLLKLMAGTEPLTVGSRIVGHNVVIGYYAQHQMEQLNPHFTVFQEALQAAADITQTQLRSLLGAFLFGGDEVDKPVAVLSGGEKARLAIAKLLLQRPNLLLLDEPTNHLDIPSRDVLEEALAAFPGTLCFISHDRHLMNALATRVLWVGSGKAELLPGNFDDFQRIWRNRWDVAGDTGRPTTVPRRGETPPGANRREESRKRQEAMWRNELYRLKQPLQKRLVRIEEDMETAQQRLRELEATLADPLTYRNGSAVQTLQREYQQVKQSIEGLTADWEERALALESLEESFWRERKGGKDRRVTPGG
jgi:ATP-binding cassette subfamily F protein 3